MKTARAYRFRIYPDVKRQSEIDNMLVLAQRLYNKLLEKSIQSYKDGNGKISMAQFNKFRKEAMAENKDFLTLYSQTRCEIEYRVMKAYQNFFRRAKEKRSGKKVKVGFPRFKSMDRYDSITYPQDNGSFPIEPNHKRKGAYLRVSKIGSMKIEMHRNVEGKIKTMTIKREGKDYYAIFTVEKEITPQMIKDTNSIGIDLGLNNFIATSDGKTIQKPKFFKKKAKSIARWQRIVARRNKGSKRREEAKSHLSQEWADITNQSNDFAQKLSNRLVDSGYTSFAIEDLHIQNMVKNHRLAQAIQNASWNRFINMLSYKAESAGMKVIKVDADNTTQECSRCHNIKKGAEKLTLKDRIYHCNVCGLQMDRDINASINILNRALNSLSSNFDGKAVKATLGQRESHAQGENCRYIPTGNASSLEELRTYPAIAGEAHML